MRPVSNEDTVGREGLPTFVDDFSRLDLGKWLISGGPDPTGGTGHLRITQDLPVTVDLCGTTIVCGFGWIECGECKHRITIMAGEIIRPGDPRMCAHLAAMYVE